MSITAYYDFHSGIAEPQTVARLLGRFDVRCSGVRIDEGLAPSARVLLAYLLLHRGEALRRERIAARLWPELGERDGRAMVRRTLTSLGRVLPQGADVWLACEPTNVTWHDRGRTTWVDAREFESLVASEDTLEEAAHLYHGDFAPALDHPWATATRERLRARAAWAFDELMTRYAARHDLRSALGYGEALLGVDPWREDALCNTMLFRYRLGDRAGSLWAYRTFAARLQNAFGIEPMPMTQRCYEAIVSGARL